MNWPAVGAVLIGAVVVVVGVKNTAGDVCQSLTGKPCPSLPGSSNSTPTTTTTTPPTTTNPNTPGGAKSCPPGFRLENGYCVPVGPSNNPAIMPFINTAIADAKSAGIDPQLFINQINQESGFNTSALSSAGAEGIAQIMPGTAKSWNVNPWDANAALQAAAQHMSGYIDQFGGGIVGEPYALAAYNAGPGSVNTRIPYNQWFAGLSSQTQDYIRRIMGQ